MDGIHPAAVYFFLITTPLLLGAVVLCLVLIVRKRSEDSSQWYSYNSTSGQPSGDEGGMVTPEVDIGIQVPDVGPASIAPDIRESSAVSGDVLKKLRRKK